jgi:hypothetical protein
VITRQDTVIGYADILAETWGSRATIKELVLDASYPEVVPWLLPRLRDEVGIRLADADPPITMLYLSLGSRHPIYDHLARYYPVKRQPYAWYIRVADLAAFIWHIKPALERRIAKGSLTGLTRTLTLDFYTSRLSLEFKDGRLVGAQNLPTSSTQQYADINFPPLVFLQMLFGYRSLKELRHAFPDVRCKPELRPILDGLFPRRRSWVATLH